MTAKRSRKGKRVASNEGLDLRAIRNAVADYMYSEGCSCCQNRDAHEINRERLAKLLKVPKKEDWYNFGPYRTKKSND